MINTYDICRAKLNDVTSDNFIKSQAEEIFKLYDSQNKMPQYPNGRDDVLKFTIKNSSGNLASANIGNNFISYYHIDEPMLIKSMILKSKNSPYYSKSTSITYRDPQSTLVEPKFSYIIDTVEIFNLDGQKIFEETTYKSNIKGDYRDKNSEFDTSLKQTSYLQKDENSEDYRMIHVLEDNDSETLLVVPMGETEDKTLQPIKITDFSPNKQNTNFESMYISNCQDISKYKSDDYEILQTSKNRANLFAGLHLESELELAKDLAK